MIGGVCDIDGFEIVGHPIGPGCPTFLIAEAGVNHDGHLDRAFQLIDIAAQVRVDAVKFQTFIAEEVVSECAPKADYQRKTTKSSESQLDMERRLQLPFDAFRELKGRTEAAGMIFLSSPFDYPSIEFLDDLDIPAFKVPSGEVDNLPFLEHIGRIGRPVILSTGMSDLMETETAVSCLRDSGSRHVAVLHCVSNYLANPVDANLRAMRAIGDALNVPTGFSDHTPGMEVSLLATAAGASIIEKHYTWIPMPPARITRRLYRQWNSRILSMNSDGWKSFSAMASNKCGIVKTIRNWPPVEASSLGAPCRRRIGWLWII